MDSTDHTEIDLPPALASALSGYAWSRQTIGHSDAKVFRLAADSRPPLFLKTERLGTFAELADEAARLGWLAGQGIPGPHVIALENLDGRVWLLMTAVAGKDLASSGHMRAASLIEIAASALRKLHALDARTCPFDHRLDRRIPLARARMEAGVVEEDCFDDERQGRTARELFRDLLALRPAAEDAVVTHGDACLPKFHG
jgi:aminoglycoside 3'-phosphotransferase II